MKLKGFVFNINCKKNARKFKTEYVIVDMN